MWLVLSFVENFLTFDNLLDSQKIAPTNSYFKSNMIIQCLINIFDQYQSLMKRINRKIQGDNLYHFPWKSKLLFLVHFRATFQNGIFVNFHFFIYLITSRCCLWYATWKKKHIIHTYFFYYIFIYVNFVINKYYLN